MQPLIPVKLNLTNNAQVKISCAAWSSNIRVDQKKVMEQLNFRFKSIRLSFFLFKLFKIKKKFIVI